MYYFPRKDSTDPWIALEVVQVEREDAIDSVNFHHRDEPRVVRLLPRHRVSHHQPAPFSVDAR